nr:hypothetical protein BCU55_09415 [Shewanella sp. 10N.286.48.A6]
MKLKDFFFMVVNWLVCIIICAVGQTLSFNYEFHMINYLPRGDYLIYVALIIYFISVCFLAKLGKKLLGYKTGLDN